VSKDELYKILIAAAHHVQNRVSQSNSNLLLGNSILVVVWATLFSRGEINGVTVIVLVALSALGWALGFGWTLYIVRSHEYNVAHTKQAEKLEKDLLRRIPEALRPIEGTKKDIWKKWGRWGISYAPALAFLTAGGFVLLHSLLMAVALYVYALKSHGDGAYLGWLTAVPIFVGVGITCVLYCQCKHLFLGDDK